MKRTLYLLLIIGLLGACSSPKYTYTFDRYKMNSTEPATRSAEFDPSIEPMALAVSTTSEPIEIQKQTREISMPEIGKATHAVSKEERKHIKQEVRKYRKTLKDLKVERTMMDSDLKLAAIFGAVGIVALLIPGTAFYVIGGVALIIGVVFLVKWLVRQ